MDNDFIVDPKSTLVMRAITVILDFKVRNAKRAEKRTDIVREFLELIDNLYDVLPYGEKIEELHLEYIKDVREIRAKGGIDRNQEIWRRAILFFRREKYYADETVFAVPEKKSGLRTVNVGDENVIVR